MSYQGRNLQIDCDNCGSMPAKTDEVTVVKQSAHGSTPAWEQSLLRFFCNGCETVQLRALTAIGESLLTHAGCAVQHIEVTYENQEQRNDLRPITIVDIYKAGIELKNNEITAQYIVGE